MNGDPFARREVYGVGSVVAVFALALVLVFLTSVAAIDAVERAGFLPDGWKWPVLGLIDFGLLYCFGLLVFNRLAQLVTRIDATGLWQPSLFRLDAVHWGEVESVRVSSLGRVNLRAGSARAFVDLHLLENPYLFLREVQFRVPAAALPAGERLESNWQRRWRSSQLRAAILELCLGALLLLAPGLPGSSAIGLAAMAFGALRIWRWHRLRPAFRPETA